MVASLVALPAAENTLKTGIIHTDISCRSDSSHSYALYLPKNYDSSQSWPLVLCFDPRGNGLWPLAAFRSAADEYGYILAGSNNSRNGPMEPNLDAARFMYKDLAERFPIDRKNIILAGFSGGVHTAIIFAVESLPTAAGIIACCRGWPDWVSLELLPRHVNFALITGIRDFNFNEVNRLSEILEEMRVSHQLFHFDGFHQWCSPDTAGRTLLWLKIRSMLAGHTRWNREWIDRQWKETLSEINQFEQSGDILKTHRRLHNAIGTFSPVQDTKPLLENLNRLNGSPAIHEFENILKSADHRNRILLSRIKVLYGQYLSSPPGSSERNEILMKMEIPRLIEDSKNISAPDIRISSQRLLDEFYWDVISRGADKGAKEDFKLALSCFELAGEIYGYRVYPFLQQARYLSALKRKDRALQALRKAVDLGFLDIHFLQVDPLLENIRGETEFRKIIRRILLNGGGGQE